MAALRVCKLSVFNDTTLPFQMYRHLESEAPRAHKSQIFKMSTFVSSAFSVLSSVLGGEVFFLMRNFGLALSLGSSSFGTSVGISAGGSVGGSDGMVGAGDIVMVADDLSVGCVTWNYIIIVLKYPA